MTKERGLYLRGSTWWMQIGDHRESCKTSNIKDARKYRSARETAINNGTFLDIKNSERLKFPDFAQLFIDNHLKVNTKDWKKNYGQTLVPENRSGLVTYFKDKYLDEITPLNIEAFKQFRLSQGVKGATVNQDLMCLGTMYRRAIAWDKISFNPMDKVKKFKTSSQRLRYFTKEELKAIVEYAKNPMKEIISTAVNTGMRASETIALKWRDIDFGKNLICIDYQKNGKLDYIPMNQNTRNILMGVSRQGNSDYVFNKFNNKPFGGYEIISHNFKDIVDELKIKGSSFHTLRHTFASYLAMAGVDLYRISKLMRHSSIKMTERYAHLSPQHINQAVEVLTGQFDSIWGNITKTAQNEIESETEEFKNIVSSIDTVS